MWFGRQVMVLVVLMAALGFSQSVVYKVGDSTGWTTQVVYDYQKWASTKTFHVGDTIVFVYNPQYHNVLQVTHAQYQSCDASSPLVMLNTGNDTIHIKKTGHFFYLCGVPGHCEKGQKVDIRVVDASTKVPSANGPATSPAPSDPRTPAPAPGPSTNNNAALPSQGFLGLAALGVTALVGVVAF